MKGSPFCYALVLLLTFFLLQSAAAQQSADASLFVGYDPSPTFPFGRPHPDADPALQEFAFMVGAFDCVDQLRDQNGDWVSFPAVWNASYFLNGHGIQDQYWAPTMATSNLRIYDPQRGKWMVTFFRMPNYASGVWEGQKEGDTMVMRQHSQTADGKPFESRLTFYDITPDSFEWKSEGVVDGNARAGWTSSCKRRR